MAKKTRPTEVVTFNRAPIPIITDGLQTTRHIGEGRWIPIVVVDPSDRPDVSELFARYPREPQGEVETRWATPKKFRHIFILDIHFKRPVQCEFSLAFDIARQGIIVDYIMDSEAVYLQVGSPGDRVRDLVDEGRILVEVPERGTKDIWEHLFHKYMARELRKRGLRRKASTRVAKRVIESLRSIRESRLRPL